MEEFILYLLKSAICTTLFFGIYWCFLKNETFYHFNRYFLIAGLLCAVLFPLYSYRYIVHLEIQADIPASDTGRNNTPPSASSQPFWMYTAILCYALFFIIYILKQLWGILTVRRVIRRNGYVLVNGCKVVYNSIFKTSFSIGSFIFIDNSKSAPEKERELIIQHELAHVKQRHWADLLLVQVICALQWFNPFIWIYLRVVKQNHEFLADHAVLNAGNPVAVYRAVLINHTLQTPVFELASSFASVNNLQRIRMMDKPESRPIKKLLVLLVLPAMLLFLYAFAKPDYRVSYIKGVSAATSTGPEMKNPPSVIQRTAQHIADTKETEIQPADQIRRKAAPASVRPKTFRSARQTTVKEIVATGSRVTGNSHNGLRKQPLKTQKDTTVMTVTNNKTGISVRSTVRPSNSPSSNGKQNPPLILIDGHEADSFDQLKPDEILSINVFKGEHALDKYGEKGKNGVISVTLKPTHSVIP
ncbi:M56 family metallopeptidase [Pedobacter sp. AW31-3R]|uniref:M56 family metallopeptidase n=1 Tax=Pedobacter sp. AW31-3R TaxID=3445781 RepID=UPI003FA0FA85